MFNLMRVMAGPIIGKTYEFQDLEKTLGDYTKVLECNERLWSQKSLISWLNEVNAILAEIFSSNSTMFLIITKNKIIGLDSERSGITFKDFDLGIVAKVMAEKNPYYCGGALDDDYYNPSIDLDSTLPLLTYPITRSSDARGEEGPWGKEKKFAGADENGFGEVLAVFQTDVWNKTLSNTRVNNFEKMSGPIFN